MSHSKQTEIDGNLARFLEVLPNILSEHEGRYALLRRGAIIGFFKDALDAQIEGNKKFDDGIFSIQCVRDDTEQLGYFSYAVDPRNS